MSKNFLEIVVMQAFAQGCTDAKIFVLENTYDYDKEGMILLQKESKEMYDKIRQKMNLE